MANHRKVGAPTLRSLSKRQWIRICTAIAAVALVVTGCVVTRSFYATATTAEPTSTETAYSATDPQAASRGNARDALGGDTASVKVVINGASQTVLGTDFTNVKSVLDAADITLEPDDTVTPSLSTAVDESTTITINRAGAVIETVDEDIAYNVIRKEDPNLAKGTEKVETEGKAGTLEKTNLVTRAGGTVLSSNTLTSYVKTAPVDKVILVGTKVATAPSTSSGSSSNSGSSANSAASTIGTTTPVGEMQQWAHDYLLANGYTEADFTATVYIISRESGWSVTATNPSSGAYGLPQALPGSKMVSAGADWATNYQTQLKWFWSYCASRYGSIQGAYNYWLANHCY